MKYECGAIIVTRKNIEHKYKTRYVIVSSRETKNIFNEFRVVESVREYGIVSLEEFEKIMYRIKQSKTQIYSVAWLSEEELTKEYELDTWERVCKEKGL